MHWDTCTCNGLMGNEDLRKLRMLLNVFIRIYLKVLPPYNSVSTSFPYLPLSLHSHSASGTP
ncbi:hypothetical protein E2C01_027297 [Portunus trituberculatus]|uniref:Uncharacterized protein n=1 Tax=Portunus trituberculatus TaxID=210409 RepID=A0A5B7ELA1_PORTR|nr:hypothetical protein [Portunus trituberculatus]